MILYTKNIPRDLIVLYLAIYCYFSSGYEINYFNRPSFYYWNGRTTIPIVETEWRDIKELQYIYLPVEWKPYTFLTRDEKHLLEQGYKLKDIKISYNVIIEGLSSILIVDIMNKMVI